jgi:hypothetical protein
MFALGNRQEIFAIFAGLYSLYGVIPSEQKHEPQTPHPGDRAVCVRDLAFRERLLGTVNFKSASGLLKIPFSFSVVPMDIGVTTVTAVQDTTVGKGTVSSYAVKTNSTGPVIVKPPTISGNIAEYSVAAGSNCNGIVAINSSCAVNVLFTPTAAGPRPQGTLSITVGGIVRTLALNGSGIAP